MKIPILFLLALALIATALLFIATTLPAPVYASDPTPVPTKPPSIRSSPSLTRTYYFPLVYGSGIDPCSSIPGQSYGSIVPNPPPTDRPADLHADLNLALRGYTLTNQSKTLVDYAGDTDPNAPQLATLFSPLRLPSFSNTYQVGSWDWVCNCQNGWITDPVVTLLGMVTVPGEIIHTPSSGYSIGFRPVFRPLDGYEAMVLYATTQRITLKYTREDNVVQGYTIHVENICVEPSLLASYNYWNSQLRSHLPALNAAQAFGRARGNEIRVSVRDWGTFLDPRSRKDWWQGY